jgi:predicted alpha/beta hydrolase family esterase
MALSTSTGTGQYVASETHVGCTGRYTNAGAKRAVLIHGGRGQTALSNMPPDTITRLVVETGAPVMYADYVDGKQWGNDTVQSRISSLWTFAQSSFGAKTDKVVLYGASMGGPCMLNWAIANPTKVAAIALVIPAVDLGDIYDNNTTASLGFTASTDIDAAYGGAGSFSGTVRTTHNPTLNASALAGIPILQFYSGNDPVCRPATQTAFQAAVGSSCTIVNMGNYGHAAPSPPDPSALANDDQLIPFLAQHA